MSFQSLYRESFNFTFDRLESAIQTVKGIDTMMGRLGRYTGREAKMRKEFSTTLDVFMQDFINGLEDDFASPMVMKTVFDLVSFINAGIDTEVFSKSEKNALIDLMKSWDQVIALFDFSLLEGTQDIPEAITKLASDRSEAKKEKNWEKADQIRHEIEALGWNMIDEKGGWRVEKQ